MDLHAAGDGFNKARCLTGLLRSGLHFFLQKLQKLTKTLNLKFN